MSPDYDARPTRDRRPLTALSTYTVHERREVTCVVLFCIDQPTRVRVFGRSPEAVDGTPTPDQDVPVDFSVTVRMCPLDQLRLHSVGHREDLAEEKAFDVSPFKID